MRCSYDLHTCGPGGEFSDELRSVQEKLFTVFNYQQDPFIYQVVDQLFVSGDGA